MKRLLWITALVFALAAAGPAVAADPPEKKFGPNVGDFVKDFKLTDPTGPKEYTLPEFTKSGKDTAFIFMQTACSLCVSEIQEFLDNKDELSGKLNVVLVSVDFDPKRITPYKEAYKIPFPILHDPGADFLESFQFNSTPATLLVDAKGAIAMKTTGYNKAELKGLIKKYAK